MILHNTPHPLSVVISVGNQSPEVLERATAGLREQTLSHRSWRLVVIDNRLVPEPGLEERFTWHPSATIARLPGDGPVTPEMRALLSCCSDLCVFVRANTILANDYLERTLELARAHPLVGMFGGHVGGQCQGFSVRWQRHFLSFFGLQTVRQETRLFEVEAKRLPSANAFVIRRDHLRRLVDIMRQHPFFTGGGFSTFRASFDYRAAMARTVVQAGGSLGLFPQLRATRVLVGHELTENTVCTRLRSAAFSRIIECFVWTGMLPAKEELSFWQRAFSGWMHFWQIGRVPRLRRAHRAGVLLGLRLAMSHTKQMAQASRLRSVTLPAETTSLTS